MDPNNPLKFEGLAGSGGAAPTGKKREFSEEQLLTGPGLSKVDPASLPTKPQTPPSDSAIMRIMASAQANLGKQLFPHIERKGTPKQADDSTDHGGKTLKDILTASRGITPSSGPKPNILTTQTAGVPTWAGGGANQGGISPALQFMESMRTPQTVQATTAGPQAGGQTPNSLAALAAKFVGMGNASGSANGPGNPVSSLFGAGGGAGGPPGGPWNSMLGVLREILRAIQSQTGLAPTAATSGVATATPTKKEPPEVKAVQGSPTISTVDPKAKVSQDQLDAAMNDFIKKIGGIEKIGDKAEIFQHGGQQFLMEPPQGSDLSGAQKHHRAVEGVREGEKAEQEKSMSKRLANIGGAGDFWKKANIGKSLVNAGMSSGGGAGSAIAGVGGAISSAAGLAGPAAPVVAVFGKIVEAVGGAINKVNEWNAELHNSAMQLAKSSGSMAQVMAEAEIRQMMLDMSKGEATAGSHKGREEEYSRYQQAAQPLDIAWTKVKNAIMEQIWGRIADAIEAINKLLGMTNDTSNNVTAGTELLSLLNQHRNAYGNPDRE